MRHPAVLVKLNLCTTLVYKGNSPYISIYEQVALFLLTIGHNCQNFLIQDVFQYFKDTVRHHFHVILYALAVFAKEMIKPPIIPQHSYEDNESYEVFFIVQGLHRFHQWDTYSYKSSSRESLYRSRRKNRSTQNIVGVCSFYLHFTWIWSRWGGSAPEWRIFTEATTRQNKYHFSPSAWYATMLSTYAYKLF